MKRAVRPLLLAIMPLTLYAEDTLDEYSISRIAIVVTDPNPAKNILPGWPDVTDWHPDSGSAQATVSHQVLNNGILGGGVVTEGIVDSQVLVQVEHDGREEGTNCTSYAESNAIGELRVCCVFDVISVLEGRADIRSDMQAPCFAGCRAVDAITDYGADWEYDADNNNWSACWKVDGNVWWCWTDLEDFHHRWPSQWVAEYFPLEQFDCRSWGYLVTQDPGGGWDLVHTLAQFYVEPVIDPPVARNRSHHEWFVWCDYSTILESLDIAEGPDNA